MDEIQNVSLQFAAKVAACKDVATKVEVIIEHLKLCENNKELFALDFEALNLGKLWFVFSYNYTLSP